MIVPPTIQEKETSLFYLQYAVPDILDASIPELPTAGRWIFLRRLFTWSYPFYTSDETRISMSIFNHAFKDDYIPERETKKNLVKKEASGWKIIITTAGAFCLHFSSGSARLFD